MRLLRLTGCLPAVLVAACGSTTEPVPMTPPTFGPPAMIPAPVSTPGWEDSGYVTPDGRTMYFTYLRIDPVVFLQSGRIRVSGPVRPGWPTTPPYDTLGAEIHRSDLVGGQWTEPVNLGPTINLPQGLEGDQWVSEDGNRILFSDGAPSLPDRPQQALYYAEKRNGVWQPAVLASSAGFPFVAHDENPHLTRDEQTLFFESSRPGGFGLQDIWMSRKVNGRWTAPENLGAAVNGPGVDGSPFSLDGTELYWDDKGGGVGIRWSVRQTNGAWRPAAVVLPGPYGDPSITESGDLYVIGGRVVADGFDADVYFVPRRR
ncbi:MAG: PD40 domain-containing protein [Gemmatimonadetes bacterium]|nr:PD40 domain-containing protein [Gemmatimonadota bacterium]